MWSMNNLVWSHQTSSDLNDLVTLGALAVQPIGAIEQHGPHLPLGTDSIIAQAVAVEALHRSPIMALLLPTISVGLSSEHLWAPGTLSFSPTTVLSVLLDTAESLMRARIRKLVFLNGHGGNSALLRVACREIKVKFGIQTFLAHPQLPRDQGGNSGLDDEHGFAIHAGAGETSLMLHIDPSTVKLDRATSNLPMWLDDYEHIGFGKDVTFGWTSDDFNPSGVIGDPTLASADHGKVLYEGAVERFVNVLDEVSRFAFPKSDARNDT